MLYTHLLVTGDANIGMLSADAPGLAKVADGYLQNSDPGRLKMADGYLSAGATGRSKMANLFLQNAAIDNATIAAAKDAYQPVIDLGRPATGHVRMAVVVNAADTVGVTVGGVLVTYTAENPVVTPTGYLRTGVAIADTAALQVVIQATQGAILASAVHAVDTTCIDLRVLAAGTTLALVESTGGARTVVQDNGEELAPADRSVYQLQRVVTAEDVLRNATGRIHIDTGLTNIRAYVLRLIVAANDNTEILYNGNITVVGGVIELDSAGVVDLAAANVIMLEVLGD